MIFTVTNLCYSLVKKKILAILRFSLNYVVDSVDLEKSWKIMMMTETQRGWWWRRGSLLPQLQ